MKDKNEEGRIRMKDKNEEWSILEWRMKDKNEE